MDKFISGYAEQYVNFCPRCGESASVMCADNKHICDSCDYEFYVIEGEYNNG